MANDNEKLEAEAADAALLVGQTPPNPENEVDDEADRALVEEFDEAMDATWGEVCQACCVHSLVDWLWISVALVGLCLCLYFFLFGLELLGTSAKVVGGCTAGSLFGDNANPVAAVMIGMMSTAMIQSSSTTTSIVVSLVSGGLDVKQAIYMIMGTNIGTTITNMLVAMGQMGDGEQLERAFAGATIHDIFNVLSVCILLPLEIVTHYLYHLTKAMLPEEQNKNGDSWEGPVKKIVAPLAAKVMISNKNLIKKIAQDSTVTCESFYPVQCEDGIESYDTCEVGLIACDKHTNECPIFFRNGATMQEDQVSGGVGLFLGVFIIIVCLIGLVALLQKMLLQTSSRIIYKATNINPYLAMVVGCGITMLVQSSSITTSTLTPLAGLGMLRLEQMFPLTLGANIGTTVTALMAASVQDKIESLQVALAHLFFNITGIVIWYPIPFMRAIPLKIARGRGRATRTWRGFPVIYVICFFFLFPIVLLGVSSLFEKKTPGYTALGCFLVVLIGLTGVYMMFWWRYKEGKEKFDDWMRKREKQRVTMQDLPENMEKLLELQDVVAKLQGDIECLLEAQGRGIPVLENQSDVSDQSKADDCTDSNEAEVRV